MIRSRRFFASSVVFIGLAAFAATWLSASPSAQASETSWLSMSSGQPLFNLAEVAPGDTGSATLVVTNPQPFPVTFSVAITGLTNDDNGCNEPERAVGDTTCGAGGGELQADLRLVLTATSRTDRLITEGTLDEWAVGPAVDALTLSGYETRTYRVDYQLPIGSSNITQSDLVAFQFEMRLDQLLESVASDPPPVIVAATASLVRTGIDPRPAILGLSAVLVGAGMWAISVRRSRSR